MSKILNQYNLSYLRNKQLYSSIEDALGDKKTYFDIEELKSDIGGSASSKYMNHLAGNVTFGDALLIDYTKKKKEHKLQLIRVTIIITDEWLVSKRSSISAKKLTEFILKNIEIALIKEAKYYLVNNKYASVFFIFLQKFLKEVEFPISIPIKYTHLDIDTIL